MKKLGKFLSLALISLSLGAAKEEGLKLIVTASSLTESDPYALFYNSLIFKGLQKPPFIILDAEPKIFENEHAVFYSPDAISAGDIAMAEEVKDAKPQVGLSGNSYQVLWTSGQPSLEIENYLGAAKAQFSSQTRVYQGKLIHGFAKDVSHKSISWPKNDRDLKPALGVMLSNEARSFVALVRARPIGGLAHRLGIIDELMAQSKHRVLLDMGAVNGAPLSIDAINAFSRRNPSVIFSGTTEMAQLLKNSLDVKAPHIYPAVGHQHSSVVVNSKTINFWTVQGQENIWPLFAKLGRPFSTEELLTELKEKADRSRHFNIVRVFSEREAEKVLQSMYVDVVLLIAKDLAQLPSQETIEFKKGAHEKVPVLIKISSHDVCEITLTDSVSHEQRRMHINRYPISEDSKKAHDIKEKALPAVLHGLPALKGLWQARDFEKVLGGIMLAYSGAHIALFESKPALTPIASAMGGEIIKNMLNPHGNMAVVSLSGKQLKEINRLASKNLLRRKINVYGMDVKNSRIGERVFNPNERFLVAMTETILLELFGISMRGGLNEDYAIRAPFVEAIYGDLKSIYFIAGPKIIPIADTQENLASVIKDLQLGRSFDDIISSWLAHEPEYSYADMLAFSEGKPHHVITFDLSYVDLGISKNFTNNSYDLFAKKEALPMGRGNVPAFTHIFIFIKTLLTYDAPSLVTTLSGEMKYLHTNMKDKPEKDKSKIGLKFRIPLERSVFFDSSVVISPLAKSVYETKILPAFWANHEKIPKRTKRIDSLLGVNVDMTKLGFNVDIGGVMANDFNQNTFQDATDFGPGMNFFSKWPLFGPMELSSEITSYYLFAMPKNTIKAKLAMGIEGTVWLRLARFNDFSVAAVSDFLIATLQNDPKNFAASSIFGLTLSYGRLFRLLG